MFTHEVSDLFFNCRFVDNLFDEEGRLDMQLLFEAADQFLRLVPSLEGEIDTEWLMKDFKERL